MPRIGTYEVNVTVDGKPLPEFSVSIDENESKVLCYIPSEVGQNFRVHWQPIVPVKRAALYLRLYLDGEVGGCCGVEKREDSKITFMDKRISDTAVRRFEFAPVSTTDNDSFIDNGASNELGDIRLVVHDATLTKGRCKGWSIGSSSSYEQVNVGDITVHERKAKATPHRIGFGKEKKRKRPSSGWNGWHVTYFPGKVLATFVFKYRPIEVLQADGIAPQPSSMKTTSPQSPNVKKRSLSEVEEDIKVKLETEEVSKKIRLLETEIIKIRDRLPHTTIKKEVKGEGQLTKTTSNPGEIIDLTLD